MQQLKLEQRLENIEKHVDEIKMLLKELLIGKDETNEASKSNEVMSVKQLAGFIGLDANIIYAKCAKGEIPFIKIGNQYRFKKDEILKWMKDQKEESEFSVDNYVERYLQKNVLKG
ncbi:helix-turn-helix domain-containing protein [Pinibacter soli]|uniref:Helix-turn-helix domain-containing protein n=1 Tax=Pinibacter soli TaxID=3044211 RepID=A0ABT6RIL9_9BACT|nr:helix-turn-helix domain-containing protein [Pinibacter soli]MDI3322422.1 helix-turn-helix domain-containing protein [Pinibacter soli]